MGDGPSARAPRPSAWEANPLSLSVPDDAMRAWLRAATRPAAGAAVAGASGRPVPAAKPLSEWTAEDFARPARPWAEVWHGGCWRTAYSRPLTVAEAQARLAFNGQRFVGNYLQLALACALAVLYKMPLAILGLVLLLKIWDLTLTPAGPPEPESGIAPGLWPRLRSVGVWVLTWMVAVYCHVSKALMWATLISGVIVAVHGCLRAPPAPPPPRGGKARGGAAAGTPAAGQPAVPEPPPEGSWAARRDALLASAKVALRAGLANATEQAMVAGRLLDRALWGPLDRPLPGSPGAPGVPIGSPGRRPGSAGRPGAAGARASRG